MALLALLLVLGLIAFAAVPLDAEARAWTSAALNIAFAGLLTGYVFRAQTSFGNRSTWHLRVDAGEHNLYFAVMAVAVLSVAVFVLLGLRPPRNGLVRSAMVVSGGVDLVLGWLVFTAFEID